MGVGVHGGICQKQAQIQIINIGYAPHKHSVYIHQNDAGKIKQIEAERTPCVFNGPSKRIVAKKTDSREKEAAGIVGKDIGEQPPNLPL